MTSLKRSKYFTIYTYLREIEVVSNIDGEPVKGAKIILHDKVMDETWFRGYTEKNGKVEGLKIPCVFFPPAGSMIRPSFECTVSKKGYRKLYRDLSRLVLETTNNLMFVIEAIGIYKKSGQISEHS